MTEEWRDVVGYEGLYQVSSSARVRSLDRVIRPLDGKVPYVFKGRVLKPYPRKHGYYTVNLCRDSIACTDTVHRLFAQAFIPNPLGLPEVNHKDGDGFNNSRDNLEWVTHRQNIQHAVDTGLLLPLRGSENGRTKLTLSQVIQIKQRLKSGDGSQNQMAAEYGVSRGAIMAIHYGYSWRHVSI